MTSRVDPALASRVLREVATHEAFKFFTDVGQDTGETTDSLTGFLKKLDDIPLKSIDFHFKRGDFEKWIREILTDRYLANRISKIDRKTCGEELKTKIQKIVKKRLERLNSIMFHRTSSSLFK